MDPFAGGARSGQRPAYWAARHVFDARVASAQTGAAEKATASIVAGDGGFFVTSVGSAITPATSRQMKPDVVCAASPGMPNPRAPMVRARSGDPPRSATMGSPKLSRICFRCVLSQ